MSCVWSPWRWDLTELKLLRSLNLLCNVSILQEKEMMMSGYTFNHRSICFCRPLRACDTLVGLLSVNY